MSDTLSDIAPISLKPDAVSWYESTARQRLRLLLDPDTFEEFIGPEQARICACSTCLNSSMMA